MYEDLIRALRCTKNENDDCPTCKYQVLCDGQHDYCDQEQLELDAAEALKAQEAENTILREQLMDANTSLNLSADACKTIEANYKSQLLNLHEQLARVTAERDAAIERTKRLCYLEYNGWCDNDEEPCDGCAGRWRGPQKEDEGWTIST